MNRALAQLRAWARNPSGAAAVEFALILPIAAFLLFVFIEVGRLLWDYHIVTASVRDAARYAARLESSCSAGSGSFDGDLTRVKRLARTGQVDGTTPLIAGWTDDASVTVTITCVANTGTPAPWSGVYKNVAEFPRVTVTATAPHTSLIGSLVPGLRVNAITVTEQQAWTS
jgi:Flp pilus assembly protein TadG